MGVAKRGFEFPNSWVIIAVMIVITAVLSWVVGSLTVNHPHKF